VRDHDGRQLAYVYFEEEHIARLPGLLRQNTTAASLSCPQITPIKLGHVHNQRCDRRHTKIAYSMPAVWRGRIAANIAKLPG